MPEPVKPAFLVNPYSEPVLIRIEGRASFLNSGSLKDFFGEMLRQGRTRFIVDFRQCTSMDSTFLGVLAGAALEVRKRNPPGTLTLARVGDRNLELIRNLGLHRLAIVAPAGAEPGAAAPTQTLTERDRSELENARLVLEAHENLVAADAANASKFQDVMAFLRNRLESR